MNERENAPDNSSLEAVFSTPNEMEAKLIVNGLSELGIEARLVGQHAAGFRAEAPQDVRVMVLSKDRTRAREFVQEFGESNEIDWDKIDVGEPE